MLVRTVSSLATLALVSAGLVGCAPDDEDKVDPTSREALKKAETLPHGCTYIEKKHSGYGTYSEDTAEPKCSPMACDSLREPASDFAYAGGATYSAYTEFTERQDFAGTCDDPQPVSCEYLEAAGDECSACMAKACCKATFFCDHDPNCNAIIECLNGCGEDAACQQRCVDNGDQFAAQNLVRAAQCMTGTCAAECGH